MLNVVETMNFQSLKNTTNKGNIANTSIFFVLFLSDDTTAKKIEKQKFLFFINLNSKQTHQC